MKSDDRDPILDVFLEEVFADAAPPDLSHRIVETWAARDQDKAVEATAEAEEPAAPPRSILPPSAPPSPQRAQGHAQGAKPNRAKNAWARLALGLALSLAVLAAIIAGTRHRNQLAEQDRQGDRQGPDGQDPTSPDSARRERLNSNSAGDDLAGTDSAAPKRGVTDPLNASDARTEEKPSAFDEPTPFERVVEKKPVQALEQERADIDPLGDQQVLAELNLQLNNLWQVNAVQPAERATDAEYCRRVFIALIGRIPTVPELDAFLTKNETFGSQGEERSWLVDRLQNHPSYRPLYVANWTNYWTNVLIGRTGGQRPGGLANREGLAIFLSESLAKGRPYDEIVTELITAEGVGQPGREDFNGAVNFLLDGYSQDSALGASRTARIFHGRQIQCVQCHNHPTNETWTQNDFWEFNAFFRQMKAKRGQGGQVRLVDEDFRGESGNSEAEAEIYFERLDGVKRVAYPVFFDGREISKRGDVASVNRRRELARLMIDSPELSRAAVNRLWTKIFYYGLTNPVDDMGDHNPPDHPEMLELLAQQFSANDYDLDRLIRWMVTSDAFQLSSKSPSDDYADRPEAGRPPLFSRYYTRQLSPEAVYDSLLLAANERIDNSGSAVGGDYIRAQRAWLGQFSKDMDTDEGQETNTFAGDIRQSVIVMTSPVMKRAVSNRLGGLLNQVTSSNMTLVEKIEHLFLAALSRKPTPRELKAVRNLVESRKHDPASGLQDAWWALLNSNEFILNH